MENGVELLANTTLLRDYKSTSHLLSLELEYNGKLRKSAGHWWEGFCKQFVQENALCTVLCNHKYGNDRKAWF